MLVQVDLAFNILPCQMGRLVCGTVFSLSHHWVRKEKRYKGKKGETDYKPRNTNHCEVYPTSKSQDLPSTGTKNQYLRTGRLTVSSQVKCPTVKVKPTGEDSLEVSASEHGCAEGEQLSTTTQNPKPPQALLLSSCP